MIDESCEILVAWRQASPAEAADLVPAQSRVAGKSDDDCWYMVETYRPGRVVKGGADDIPITDGRLLQGRAALLTWLREEGYMCGSESVTENDASYRVDDETASEIRRDVEQRWSVIRRA